MLVYIWLMRKFIPVFILIIIFLSFSGKLSAQKKKTSKSKPNPTLILADKHYNNLEYYLAAHEYARVLKSDSANAYAMFQLAECYRLFFDYRNAEKYYQKTASRFRDKYPLARFWYATMLKDNGDYKKAVDNFNKYRDEHTDTDLETELYREKAAQEINGCYLAMEENNKPKKDYGFKCLPKPVNSPESDFSPIIYENDTSITITSARKGSVGGHKDNSLGGAFTDSYRFQKAADTVWDITSNKTKDEFHKLNSQYNESAGSFTGDKKKFYFTRCDELIKVDNYEEYNCAIYVSYNKDGKWQKPIRLNENINTPGQWNSQPSVSPDGNILFFVSKRPGGLGLHDIWYSTCNGDDQWGPPINLGDKINTLFIDVSPRYYADQKVLFFSSNGHGGHGGLDIFLTKEEDGFAEIINLGQPFNSNRDDFYFVLGEKKGYITSNREGGVGNDDIYTFNITNKVGLIRHIEDSTVNEDAPDEPPVATNTNTNPDTIKSAPEPLAREELISKINKDNSTLQRNLTATGVILDSTTNKPAANVEVALLDEVGNVVTRTTTDENGNYKIEDVPGNKPYRLVLNNKDSKTNSYKKPAPVLKYNTVTEPLESKEILISTISKDTLLNKKSMHLTGTIINPATNKVATHGTVSLVDEFGNVVKTVNVGPDGKYKIDYISPSIKDYKVIYNTKAPKNDNFIAKHTTRLVEKSPVPETTQALIATVEKNSIPGANSISIDGIILYEENKKPAANATILLVDENGTTIKTSKTDKNGFYRFTNLPADRTYKVILQQGNLKGNSEDKKYFAEKVNVKGSDVVSSKKLFENIYFDFDKYDLRPEAKKVLDDLTEYCKQNPNAQIELYANTDSYGSSLYNKVLAGKRGKSALDYLVEKGVSQSSLVVTALGEGKAIASNETELGRQLNRRVEFYILGGSNVESKAMAYVIEPKKTLFSLAKEYNMSVQELKDLNGLVGDELVAYTPLRVKRTIGDNDIIASATKQQAFSNRREEKKYQKHQEELIAKNIEVNKNLDVNSGDIKKYIDSASAADKNTSYNGNNTSKYEGSNIAYYITQPKNTLYNIARLYGMKSEDLKSINNLSSDTIYIGQKIKVDLNLRDQSIKGYLVKEGDTIGGIAKRFGLTIDELLEINNLDGYVLRRNMLLRLKKD